MGKATLILRPDAVVLPDGTFAPGLEVCVEQGRIDAVRPWSSASRDETGLFLSPAFVNAHSHLEYRDLQGKIAEGDYWQWIREITRMKPSRTIAEVQAATNLAAQENVAAGIALVGEISDWPVSGAAMKAADLGGIIFQEVITVAETEEIPKRLGEIRESLRKNEVDSGLPTYLSAHTPYTCTESVITDIAKTGNPNSIHLAESPYERQLFVHGAGPIAQMYQRFDTPFTAPGVSSTRYLAQLGALHAKTQVVHLCDVDNDDIAVIAASGATAAHCPRSNLALSCPIAPVKKLLDAGIVVGLGLDSAASSGPIDMFAEMRAALASSRRLGESLSAETVWQIATDLGARSIFSDRRWRIETGGNPDLVLWHARGASPEEVIRQGARVAKMIRLGS